ncbi:FecR domain-containing protein [Pseudomonas sp. ABC1]|uniref:FecR domain-containing protein n=1 Tax=Pseudomonas sp. ABC1 TaxID=2748080 RepID=UPI0015C33060|nr:FecR domain-containing protein [Pseudomonas sp. ABC1]QLF93340.1 FecR domain-containing protein [Pseudomonas sp. ABC1]
MAADLETLESAAQWYVDLYLQPADPQVREAHEHWLLSDPRHRQAWARVEKLQAKLGNLPPALARPALDNAREKRRATLKVLALLLTTGGVASLGLYSSPIQRRLADLHTDVGQRLQRRLEDGSLLQLNSASALDLRYSASLRELYLHSGEICVETATDPAGRPFIVQTPQGTLRALGTRFLVRSEDGRTTLDVLQHAVEARPLDSEHTMRVEAGQRLHFDRQGTRPVETLPAHSDAWTHGQLIASDWRLGDFLDELSRHRPGYLGYASDVAGLRISGAFQLADSDTVLDNLSHTLPIRVRRFSRYWTRVEAAPRQSARR